MGGGEDMFNEDTKIGELLKSDEAKRIMNQNLSGIADDPQINMVKGFSLKTLAAFTQAKIPKEKLDICIEELKRI